MLRYIRKFVDCVWWKKFTKLQYGSIYTVVHARHINIIYYTVYCSV